MKSTKRVPLFYAPANRSSDRTKDQKLVNCYLDAVAENEAYVVKRPGLTVDSAIASGEGRGVYAWQGNKYSVVDNILYKGTSANSTNLLTSANIVRFATLDTGTKYLLFNDGKELYRVTSGDVVDGAKGYAESVSLVNTTYKWTVSGSGTNEYYVDLTGGGDPSLASPAAVYETATGDMSSASALTAGTVGSLTAGQYDYGDNDTLGYSTIYVRLTDNSDPDSQANDYVRSSASAGDPEYPATTVPGLVVIDGITFVMDSNGTIYNSQIDNPFSWLAQDFISAEIDSDDGVAIAKHLNYAVAFGEWTTEIFYNAGSSPGSPLARIQSSIIRIGCSGAYTVAEGEGILMWVGKGRDGNPSVQLMSGLNPSRVSTKPIEKILEAEGSGISNAYAYFLKTQGHYFYVLTLPTTAQATLVYDIVDGQWCEWTSYDGATESYFDGISAADVSDTLLIQHRTDGDLYAVSPTTYQDNSNDIKFKIVTREIDFDNNKTKFHHILELIGDRATTASQVSVRWTDDDYQNWSTARTVDMNKRATLFSLGRFQRRAFEMTHTANTSLRLSAMEITGELGVVTEGANG